MTIPCPLRAGGTASRALHLIADLVVEARPPILAIFALRMVVASRLAHHPTLDRAVLTLAWVMLTMAVYVFNGTSDIAGDVINRSPRPLATGRLSLRSAWIACAALALGALGLAWWCGAGPGLCAAASLALGWCYSSGPRLKRSSVGFAVTIFGGAALTYLAGSEETAQTMGVSLGLVAFAVWIGLSSGAKDLSDAVGDQADGRHTWPVVFGVRRAAVLLICLSVACTALLAGLVETFARTLSPAAAVLAVGTGWFAWRLARLDQHAAGKNLRRPYQSFMVTQFAVNLAILLCVR